MKRLTLSLLVLGLAALGRAGTINDNFNTNRNYLTGGVTGTIWDGVYLGAGEFANQATLGPGKVTKLDANINTANELSVISTGTAWENTQDDGFYIYKVVKGDFSATVHVVTPFTNTAYNTAGLEARAYGTGGNPLGGSEDYVSWTRFDQNFAANNQWANYLRSEVNGGASQINPSNYPNSAYWLRMDRVGNVFRFYEKTNSGDAWTIRSFGALGGTNLTRNDLAGLPLQVGIIQCTFTSSSLSARFSDFSITATNFDTPVAPPSAATGLTLATNGSGNINIGWNAGAGSAGSVVVVWTGSNTIKQLPVNGTAYNGSANYGTGDQLLATNYFLVYSGSGTSVSVSNILTPGTYNVAVYSYAGSGGTISYNRSAAPTGSFTIQPTVISATATTVGSDVWVTFAANLGKWYWLQYSDSLTPPNWQNVVPGPTLATNSTMTLVHVGGALNGQRFYRVLQLDPLFNLNFVNNAVITGLQRTADAFITQYMTGRLGDANLKYRQTVTNWTQARTSTGTGIASTTFSVSPDGTQHKASYQMTSGTSGGPLVLDSIFTVSQSNIQWTLTFSNLTSGTVEIGDLALPFPMNENFSGAASISNSVKKHHYIEGYGSYIFWMRPNSVGPYLLLTPNNNTKLEYWDVRNGGFEAYVHSLTQSLLDANANVTNVSPAPRWRQPNTSLMLASGGVQSYGFKFQWVNDYDNLRQSLVNESNIDVHVVPGMTLPTNVPATIALRTSQTINSVTAEFPGATTVTYLGSTNVGASGTYQLYQAQFSQLGENKLTINYGPGNTTYLEFFITEPLETLIKKRANYLANTIQFTNISPAASNYWYNWLYTDMNLNDNVRVSPDNHDSLGNSFQVYEIASDDAGESRPAYMASKEALYPVQSEVTSIDNYIYYYVWNTPTNSVGGMQRKTNESSSYGVYGINNWRDLRAGNSLSLGRGYDYPHFIVMYEAMYRLAKYHPEISTYLTATNYLLRAYGTAMAMWSFGGVQATQIGLMNELVITDVINELVAEGYTTEAGNLRTKWETKIAYYVNGNGDLFASEYAFDATGFESQQAYAKYADRNAGTSALMGSGNVTAFRQSVTNYMRTEIGANVFDRGWIETAYYYYGSDYRGNMGNDFVVTYMAAMGGWGLLDYGWYYAPTYATNQWDYLRLGMASYLNGWSTMNTDPTTTNGYWYPGTNHDGACGGGFEPSPIESTWLGGQAMHRGAWYYSAEEDLGFCGALRMASSALSDDPIFGRYSYLSLWSQSGGTNQVIPQDGVRRRFHAMLSGSTLHLVLDNDRFSANQPIKCTDNQTYTSFMIESEVTSVHNAILHLTVSVAGTYTISNNHGTVLTQSLTPGTEYVFNLPVDASVSAQPFTITH